MPDSLTFEALKSEIANLSPTSGDSFAIARGLSFAARTGTAQQVQELVLRALEKRDFFGSSAQIVDALVRELGLFPYLKSESLGERDLLALEMHRPMNTSGVVFHHPQAAVYWQLIQGKNVVLSAPTSFGKSLIIDALVATEKFHDILIVVPTIALIDETRRRLTKKYGNRYKVITHGMQSRRERNIFVMTQERVHESSIEDEIDFFVIDEFYKLSWGRDKQADRAALLNEVFYRLLKTKKQFYLLGPNVADLSQGTKRNLDAITLRYDYNTVVSEIHDMRGDEPEEKRLVDLCRELKEPAIIYCKSPGRASDVASILIANNIGEESKETASAADWIGSTFHPDWLFGKALRRGIGIHHGRIPRSLAQYVVQAFDNRVLPFLICTSTLIEGVNTKAKHIVILDDQISNSKFDLFTFNNIKGRSGRMGEYFVGHVYIFNEPPVSQLPVLNFAAVSPDSDTPEELLMQFDRDDLPEEARKRLLPYQNQELLSYETLKKNDIDPDKQLQIASDFARERERYGPLLQWDAIPTYEQLQCVSDIIWFHFAGYQLGRQSVSSQRELTYQIWNLKKLRTTREVIEDRITYRKNIEPDVLPGVIVQKVLDFTRLWANFHFPKLLRVIDRIQRDVFSRFDMETGDYEAFASQVENLFMDPVAMALDEYGIPLEIVRKIEDRVIVQGDLDESLNRLKKLDLSLPELTRFERSLIASAKNAL
jgi:DEAD/DEAH box helicase